MASHWYLSFLEKTNSHTLPWLSYSTALFTIRGDQLKPNRTNLYRSNLIQAILNVWCDPRTWMARISNIHLWVLGTILNDTTCNLTYWSLATTYSITETWSSFVQVMVWCLFGAKPFVNSLRPSDAYMRQLTRPSLVQIMACRLNGAKPLSEPMLEYC